VNTTGTTSGDTSGTTSGYTTGTTTAGTGYALHSDIRYLPDAEDLQALDVYVPAGAAPAGGWPAVIYVHGGAFAMGDKAEGGPSMEYALLALDHGFAMVSVNYRLVGVPQVALEIDDVWAALRWVAENAGGYGIDGSKLAFLGPSAGASLTSVVGARANAGSGPKVAAVIGISGAYQVTKSADYLDANSPPFYLAHGTKDSAVDIRASEDFRTALDSMGIPCVFVAAEGADHCRAVDDPHIYKVLGEMGKLDEAYVWLKGIIG
jgi:acetyl esterase/lipase